MGILSFFTKDKKEKLDKGLFVTKQSFFSRLAKAIAGKAIIDHEVLAQLEEMLITSDVGVDTTLKIIEGLKKRVEQQRKVNTSELNSLLRDEISKQMFQKRS